MKRICLLALLAMSWNLSSWAREDESVIDFSDIDYSSTPTAEQFPQASAVTLLKEGKIDLDKKGFFFTKHVIRKVFNERGQDCATQQIYFNKGNSDIEMIKARTITPEGKVIELDKSQFFEVTDFPDYVLYNDYKAKRFTFSAVQSGAILEYVYKQRLSGIQIPTWYFQEDRPVLFSRFIMEIPLNIRYKLLKRRGDIGLDIKEEREERSGMLVATFSARDIPATVSEPCMPPQDDVIPSLSFTPVVASLLGFSYVGSSFYLGWYTKALDGYSWSGIGSWYTEVTESKAEPGDELRDKAQELVSGCSADQQRAKAICEFVRDNFRYVSIDVANGGFKPHDVNNILTNRYGDCKDLSLLTVALLKEAGIKARIGLVRTADEGVIEKSFCSSSVFNHAVVCIPQEAISDSLLLRQLAKAEPESSHVNDCLVFDPTVRWCPFGYLPWADLGVEVLVANGDSSAFVTSPVGKPEENSYSVREMITTDGKKEQRELALTCRGAAATEERYRYNGLDEEKTRERIERLVLNLYTGATLDSFKLPNLKQPDSLFKLNIYFTVAKAQDFISGPQITSLTAFDGFGGVNPFTKDKREHPISFEYPQASLYECEVRITNPSLCIRGASDTIAVDWSPVGKYREEWDYQPGMVKSTKKLNIETVWARTSSYNIVKDLFCKNSAYSQKRIMIDKKTETAKPTSKKTKN